MVETIQWTDAGVVMIDQTKLPREEVYVTCTNYQRSGRCDPQHDHPRRSGDRRGSRDGRRARHAARGDGGGVRPDLRNSGADPADRGQSVLGHRAHAAALQRAAAICRSPKSAARLVAEAQQIRLEDIAINEAIGRNGAGLIPDGKTVLTHCNAGALATAGYGTALGVIRAAVAAGKNIDVFADETRPFLQGSRLTVWELQQDGIPATLITDNMAGHFLKSGPDRLRGGGRGPDRREWRCREQDRHLFGGGAGEGERHSVLCGGADFDAGSDACASGDQIPIEQRSAAEVTHVYGVRGGARRDRRGESGLRCDAQPLCHARSSPRRAWRARPIEESLRELVSLMNMRLILVFTVYRAAVPVCVGRAVGPPGARLCAARSGVQALLRSAGLSGQSGADRHHVHHLPALYAAFDHARKS